MINNESNVHDYVLLMCIMMHVVKPLAVLICTDTSMTRSHDTLKDTLLLMCLPTPDKSCFGKFIDI